MRVLAFPWMLAAPAWAIVERSSTSTAVEISPSEFFEGNDGPWSSFFLRVGTPEQDVRVLVSTASSESMVVLSEFGCSTAAFTTVPADCAVSRGNLFNLNKSSSWQDLGIYGINQDGVGLEANLGYSQRTDFALDTLGLGLTGPKLENQTVAGIATADPFYLGIFGLNPQPVNLSSLGNFSSPSFLTSLKDQGVIPSLSWSYTAGAKYRLKQVYAQLIFSGYDTSRFTANSASFTMAGDITRDLVVYLQSITYSGTSSSVLLSDPIQIFVDSTDPNLWLPESVCTAFEEAFGLTLDDTTGMYLVNDTHNAELLNSNAQVAFRLSDVASGGDSVTITLPYAAFALTAQAPLVKNQSFYFPLKRADNSTQYTLGRAFLQEAYLSADYERGVFNVSACAWNEGAQENIVTITPKGSATSTCSGSACSSSSGTSGGPSSLSRGAVAGITIGSILGAAILAAAIFFIIRRRRQKKAFKATDPQPDMTVRQGPVLNGNNTIVHGAQPTGKFTQAGKFYSPDSVGGSSAGINEEVNAGEHSLELDGDATEIPLVYHELPAAEVGRTELDPESSVSSRDARGAERQTQGGDELAGVSPIVSSLGTARWQDKRKTSASDDLVSPIIPQG